MAYRYQQEEENKPWRSCGDIGVRWVGVGVWMDGWGLVGGTRFGRLLKFLGFEKV